jgi:peptide/nickel transport system substrate-binding protein
MRFQSVEDYPEGRPAIRNLVIRFFNNAAQARGQEIHVDTTGEVSGLTRVDSPAQIFEHIAFNLDSPLLRDRRVREALIVAVDRDAALRQRGVGEVASTWLPPRHSFHAGNVRQYRFGFEAAKKLLAEAGWTLGPDGVLRNQAGDRFELVFMTTPNSPARERVQDAFIAQWRAVGVEVRKENPSDFFTRLGRRQFQHLAMFAWVFGPFTDADGLWNSSAIPSQANGFQGQNYYGWRNSENDRLVAEMSRELRESQRAELMRRQQEIWAEELPAIPLFFLAQAIFVHRDLQNVRPISSSFAIFWNVHQWAWR